MTQDRPSWQIQGIVKRWCINPGEMLAYIVILNCPEHTTNVNNFCTHHDLKAKQVPNVYTIQVKS